MNKLKLDFLKRILTDTVDFETYNNFFKSGYPSDDKMNECINVAVDEKRNEGLDWPERAHTMIGIKRLNNLHNMLDYVRENNIFYYRVFMQYFIQNKMSSFYIFIIII